MLLWTWGLHISFQISVFVFFSKYPEVELLDLVALFLIVWGTSILFSVVAAPIYIPTNSARGFPFLHTRGSTCYRLSFWWSHSDRCGDTSLCFWTAFPWWLVRLSIFLCACWPSVCLLWKNVCSGPLPIFKSDCFFHCCVSSLCILDINPLSDKWFANIFSQSVGCLFILLMVSFAV